MRLMLALRRWWADRRRFWLNQRILYRHADELARRFTRFGIDVKNDRIEYCMEQLEQAELVEEAAQATQDLFAADPLLDPFGRFGRRTEEEDGVSR